MTQALTLAIDSLQPHVVACALIAARLLPVTLLCPLFGGAHAPMHVKLGIVLALTFFLHGAAGVGGVAIGDVWSFAALAGRELLFGLALGLVASLPFDAARMGGRFIDLFRGSSAEAALPMSGSREAASGDLLYHLLLAMGATTLLLPFTAALVKSYALAPPGVFVIGDVTALHLAGLVGAAFATGLALGAPIAAMQLTVDAALSLASRAAPGMNLQDTGAPLRILGGGALLWLLTGALAARLQDVALHHSILLTELPFLER